MGKDAFGRCTVCFTWPARAAWTRSSECWKDLDRLAQVQLENARELAGWGPAARTLSRVIRLFQPRLFQRLFQRPTDLRQELARLQEAVNPPSRGWTCCVATIRENPGKIGVLGTTKRAEDELRFLTQTL